MTSKGVYFYNKVNKWVAQYWNRELKTTICIGTYNSKNEAIEARTRHICRVYDGEIDDSLPKTKGLPKGVAILPTGKYAASLQYWHGKHKDKKVNTYLGCYDTQEEAEEERKQFILRLL